MISDLKKYCFYIRYSEMKKLFSKKTYIPAVLIIFSIFFFLKRDMIYGSSGNKDENLENKQSRLIKSSEPEILGKIGDYSISSSQLRARLLLELDPGSYQIYTMQTKPADAKRPDGRNDPYR